MNNLYNLLNHLRSQQVGIATLEQIIRDLNEKQCSKCFNKSECKNNSLCFAEFDKNDNCIHFTKN